MGSLIFTIIVMSLSIVASILHVGNKLFKELLYRNQLQEEENGILRNNYYRKGNEGTKCLERDC